MSLRAIVFGAHGTLGRALVDTLPGAGYTVVAAPGHGDCDVADAARVRAVLADTRADAVFNAAAYTDVDGAETNPDAAFRANALGPETLARVCEGAGAKLVHYSTDFVFDGALGRPYDEFDTPNPQGVYARSKLAGERLIMASTRRAIILRVGWLYGRGGRNFPSTILRRLRAGETIRADAERLGGPTWVLPVAVASAALARTEHFGLHHAAAQGETTWADYARFLAAALGLPADRVQGLPTSALPMRAPRPHRSSLDNRLLRLRGLDTLGSWQEQVTAYMNAEAAAPA